MTRVICAFCGFDFDPSNGNHGCAESKLKPDLVARLCEDHCDTIECEHGFLLHRDPCPNAVCLARDLAAAADTLTEVKSVIDELCAHEGAEGFSAGTHDRVAALYKRLGFE